MFSSSSPLEDCSANFREKGKIKQTDTKTEAHKSPFNWLTELPTNLPFTKFISTFKKLKLKEALLKKQLISGLSNAIYLNTSYSTSHDTFPFFNYTPHAFS